MQPKDLTVCNISLFGEGVGCFWLDKLSGLLDKFPVLEFPHSQDFYTLIIVEEADGEVIIDNLKIRLDSPKALIIKPRCISSIDLESKADGTIICFTEDFFALRYNNNILHQFSFFQRDATPYIRLTHEYKIRCEVLVTLIEEEYNLRKKETQKVLRSYLNIILFELERSYKPLGYVKTKNIKQEKVHEFEMLIEKHFETKKLPSVYAEFLNISPNYLNKICKEETGKTAGDLIRKRIIIEAQRFLHYTNYSVNEIADKLSFETTSYFVTFFKKHTGITPEQFRKGKLETEI